MRIIDATSVIAGPFASSLLADFGAEVIKVEQPGTGDQGRGMGPFAKGEPLRHASLNRNKKGITLDLGRPQGAEIFRRLCGVADVTVEKGD